jgi:L-aspartate oxidase
LERIYSDILVVGSGVAGLFFALNASKYAEITVITKKDSANSNTRYAQGGIASVMSKSDSFQLHVADTISAGKGLCDREAVELMVKEGPERLKELVDLGVHFSKKNKGTDFQLGREGGHSEPRVVHYGDMTGIELENKLLRAAEEKDGIKLEEWKMAIDLLKDQNGRIVGCKVLDVRNNEVKAYLANNTVLATGGTGKIYLYTSNPDIATGDGIAMAYRAGAKLANLEFVQFHPTCFYHPESKSLLITEALRGEGAVLRNISGESFMAKYAAERELAPRDIVARAIDREMKKRGDKYVLLDITHRSSKWLKERFPFAYESCLKFGVDIGTDPIPVVPAAHYMCGGVKIDMGGKTNLPGLSAIGEVGCSGVHGANRLASNSILEALVIARRCAERLKQEGNVKKSKHIENNDDLMYSEKLETVIVDHDWDLTRRVMWDYVGIVRSRERLGIARERVRQIHETVERIYSNYGISSDMVELRNLALVSSLVIESAQKRKESRGLHYMVDYPHTDPAWKRDTILSVVS